MQWYSLIALQLIQVTVITDSIIWFSINNYYTLLVHIKVILASYQKYIHISLVTNCLIHHFHPIISVLYPQQQLRNEAITIRYFLLRMINNMTMLNYHLSKWSIKNTNICSFCNSEIETVKHFFFDCKIVKKFWIDIQKYTKAHILTYFILVWTQITLSAIGYNELSLNTVKILHAKYHLYQWKFMYKLPSLLNLCICLSTLHT